MESVEKARLSRTGSRAPGQLLSLAQALPAVTAAARLRYAGACIAVAMAAGMLFSRQLWLTRPPEASLRESFPRVAPLPGLDVLALPQPLDAALFVGTLVLCATAAIAPQRLVFAALFAACLLLALPDMMRWQPWFYLYTAAIGILAFVPQASPGSRTRGRVGLLEPLQIMRLLVASVYFYSGANKMNAAFFEERLAGFLSGMPTPLSEGPVAAALTYSAPALEMAAGLGLLVGGYRVRHAALLLAGSTNLFVLMALIPATANTVVWPWNAAMVALVVILFAGRDEEAAPIHHKPRRSSALLPGYLYAAVVIVLFAAAPAAGVAGYWPSYLSFALYSENVLEASVEMPGEAGRTNVTSIAYESLNVPPFPSLSVYQALAESACAGGPRDPVLIIQGAPNLLTGSRQTKSYTCEELREVPWGERKKDPEQPGPPG